jgi:hypothetical protein
MKPDEMLAYLIQHADVFHELINAYKRMELSKTKARLASSVETTTLFIQHLMYQLNRQTWFLDRMQVLGYRIDKRGQCYGMSSMSMQAFFSIT